MRSWLIVAADDESALTEAASAGADAVVLDLDSALGETSRVSARGRARDWVRYHRQQVLEGRQFTRWVRISPLESPHWRADLAAALEGGPDGIILPGATDPARVQQLAAEFYEAEQRAGMAHGATRILPLVSNTPASVLGVTRFADDTHPRLAGLGWDAGRLGDALDTRRTFDESGSWSGAFALARANLVLAAKARDLMAIETSVEETSDMDRFAGIAEAARADGFSGMFALTAKQVAAINRAFQPTEGEISGARHVIAQFEINPEAEHVAMGGRMIDRAYLARARRLVEQADRG